jgi:integration host factor subunit beta
MQRHPCRLCLERYSAPEAAAVVDLIFDQPAETLATGDRMDVTGLASFYVKEYKGYTGRNPTEK